MNYNQTLSPGRPSVLESNGYGYLPRVVSAKPSVTNAKPDFFIVGAPKCGTTAMVEYLSRHPDIFMAKKEMHFFGSDLHLGQQFYRRECHDYLKEFAGWNGQSRTGEASVWYLFSKQAAAEIKAFNPKARIIIMLRSPTEMLYSLYNQFRLDNNEHLPTFGESLAAQNDRRLGRQIARHTYFSQGLIYEEVVSYTEQIRRYYQAFGRERVKVVIYDDFAADAAGVFGKVIKFLDLDKSPLNHSFPVINEAKTARSPFLRDVMNDPLVRGTAVAARPWLPRPIFTTLQKIETRLMKWNYRPKKRPPLDPGLQRSLQREFAPEVERLSDLLGRDLTRWNKLESLPARHDGCH